jgi:hypothetical protein
MSRVGVWAAGIYMVVAIWVVVVDARESATGGWISLKNMGAFLVTLPVSGPLSMMGLEPNLGNPVICGLMVLLTAGLIYGVCRLVAGR